MFEGNNIAVVVPCYRVNDHIEKVIGLMPDCVDMIICVDDACPQRSGDTVRALNNPRVSVITHQINQGVGGAVKTGYQIAISRGADIVVKIDGDGQMDPRLIENFIKPIAIGNADYTKGNRFYNLEDVSQMPVQRIFGNLALSFFNKLSSGYWSLFDPTNGYTAIHSNILRVLPIKKISCRYFFESDMLFRLNIVRAHVVDVPMAAVYGDEKSSLKIHKIIPEFLRGHFVNLVKRVAYNYFLRDFSIASIELILGIASLLFGTIFGITAWTASIASGEVASTGTVMVAALPVILGMQLVLSFIHYDISTVPTSPIYPLLNNKENRTSHEA